MPDQIVPAPTSQPAPPDVGDVILYTRTVDWEETPVWTRRRSEPSLVLDVWDDDDGLQVRAVDPHNAPGGGEWFAAATSVRVVAL